MNAPPPLIPYLRNVKLWVWLGIIGGALVLVAILMAIAVHDLSTPAHHLVGWHNGWLFLLPVAMVAYGVYVSARYWRCPQCGDPLPTKRAIPAQCRQCGALLRGPAGR